MNELREILAGMRYLLLSRGMRPPLYVLAGISLVLLAVSLVWWLPPYREHAQLEQEISGRRSAIVEAARLAAVAEAERNTAKVIALYEKKLDSRMGQADLIREVARLAGGRGVRVNSQSFEQGRTQKGGNEIYLSLGLTGSYSSIRRLLGDIASIPAWLEVVDTHLERAGDGGGMVRAQLRLATFSAMKDKKQ